MSDLLAIAQAAENLAAMLDAEAHEGAERDRGPGAGPFEWSEGWAAGAGRGALLLRRLARELRGAAMLPAGHGREEMVEGIGPRIVAELVREELRAEREN